MAYQFHCRRSLVRTCSFLRYIRKLETKTQIQNSDTLLGADVFPVNGESSDELPLPEDYHMRGLSWSQNYFPKSWFQGQIDEDGKTLEMASTVKNRIM
jgi:hypothetical protein